MCKVDALAANSLLRQELAVVRQELQMARELGISSLAAALPAPSPPYQVRLF